MPASRKTRLSAEHNVRCFFADHPVTYYWTFTFDVSMQDKDEAETRFRPLRDLVRRRGGKMMEFWELHPGGHGWHVHVLTNLFFDVTWMRGADPEHKTGFMTQRGWGKIMKVIKVQSRKVWVDGEGWVRDDRDEAKLIRYLVKYLTKAFAAASHFKKKVYGCSRDSRKMNTMWKAVPWENPWSYIWALGAARFEQRQGRRPRFTEMNLVLRIGYHVSGWEHVDPWLMIDGATYNST